MICEWSSSRFPQNSFSPISFIIPFYSLFHPPFLPRSPLSSSSPLIPAIHFYSHSCFLCIHFHPMLPLSHFHHTHSYPFPFHSSHSIPFHHFHSFAISLLTLHSHTFSCTFPLHYQVFILFSLIPTLFIDSYHSSFLFNVADLFHLISSLLILITSLYLLSFSINLDSILCSMYYDLSISYPYLSLITLLFFYSISFYSYSYSFSPMPIHFIVSHSSIRHHTQLLMSIHSHLNTPYPLSSFMLSHFYSVIHISLHPPSLFYSIFIHPLIPFLYLFIIYSSFFPFIPFHIILSVPFYSHSILHPFPFQHHSPFLFFLSLLHTTLRFDSLLLLSSLFPDSFLLSFSSYISILFFHIYLRNIYSIHSLLSYPFTHILLSSRLLYSAEVLHSNKSKGQLLVQRELGLYLPNCELCITPAPSIWILFLFRLYSV